jgi:hypothetical protein
MHSCEASCLKTREAFDTRVPSLEPRELREVRDWYRRGGDVLFDCEFLVDIGWADASCLRRHDRSSRVHLLPGSEHQDIESESSKDRIDRRNVSQMEKRLAIWKRRDISRPSKRSSNACLLISLRVAAEIAHFVLCLWSGANAKAISARPLLQEELMRRIRPRRR